MRQTSAPGDLLTELTFYEPSEDIFKLIISSEDRVSYLFTWAKSEQSHWMSETLYLFRHQSNVHLVEF